MLPPVVCFGCGCPLNMYAKLFEHVRQARMRAKLGTTRPRFASVDPESQIDMKDILDQLNISSDCCRTRLTTSMTWQDSF